MSNNIDKEKYDAYQAEQEIKLWKAKREEPIIPKDAIKTSGIINSNIHYDFGTRGELDSDFEEKVKEISKYYNTVPLMINEDTFRGKDFNSLFLETKKRKVTTINDKAIVYTHCIPSSIDLIKFTWRQRLKILLGIKVNVTINTYLNSGKIEATILKINN